MGNSYEDYIYTGTPNKDIVKLNEYDEIAKMGLSCVYTICSAICSELNDPARRINVLKSYVKRDHFIEIVAHVPKRIPDSMCNEMFMEGKDIIKLLFQAFDNVIANGTHERISVMYEASKTIVNDRSMKNASTYYLTLSNFTNLYEC